ncbi:response regulator [Candidatus Woesearchaeota archaeon]|nr:response regulator [Candidatus Woesearchaeota archaeon]
MVKNIMIVDDNPDLLFSVKHGIESTDSNFKVISVKSAEKCLEKLKNKELPDLILLDIMMPGINGWEMFDKLKENENWKNIPVIFLTARTDNVAKNAGKFLAEDYIEKPFEVEDLIDRINKSLNK